MYILVYYFLLLQGFFNFYSTRWTLFSSLKSQFIIKASSGGPEDGIGTSVANEAQKFRAWIESSMHARIDNGFDYLPL